MNSCIDSYSLDKLLVRQLGYDAEQFLPPDQSLNVIEFFQRDGKALRSNDEQQYQELRERLIGYVPTVESARKLANGSDVNEQVVRAVFGITGYISLLDSAFRPGHEKINELEASIIAKATEMHGV